MEEIKPPIPTPQELQDWAEKSAPNLPVIDITNGLYLQGYVDGKKFGARMDIKMLCKLIEMLNKE